MKYPKYPAYKESGVEWLGEIPEHWSTHPLKRIADVRLSNIDKHSVEGQQPVDLCNYVDVYKNERITNNFSFMRATASDDQISRLSLKKGDVIITKDSETPDDIGVPALVDDVFDGVVCGYHLALLRPISGIGLGTYIHRTIQSTFVRSQFSISAMGMTRYGLGKYSIENAVLPLPPVDEQRNIAAFLDAETAQIDTLIAKQERLIALLQEKRQALISHAVTKGLNPAAPMKDSGVEWLGEVPAHWEAMRNQWIFSEVNERSTTGEEELLSVSHITGVTPRSEKNVNMFMAETLEGYKLCQPGDLIINTMWAYMGALGVSEQIGLVSPSYNVYRPKDASLVNSKYLDCLYRTPDHIVEIKRNSKGVWESRLRLYPANFLAMQTPLPPRNEQDEIVAHLDRKLNLFATVEQKCLSAIAVLQERRTALISAAVTGKIDVRAAMN